MYTPLIKLSTLASACWLNITHTTIIHAASEFWVLTLIFSHSKQNHLYMHSYTRTKDEQSHGTGGKIVVTSALIALSTSQDPLIILFHHHNLLYMKLAILNKIDQIYLFGTWLPADSICDHKNICLFFI